MAFYSFKRVMGRKDYQAVIQECVQETNGEFGRWEYEGDANYDGDAWLVTEFLLNKKDAEIAALRTALQAAEEAQG